MIVSIDLCPSVIKNACGVRHGHRHGERREEPEQEAERGGLRQGDKQNKEHFSTKSYFVQAYVSLHVLGNDIDIAAALTQPHLINSLNSASARRTSSKLLDLTRPNSVPPEVSKDSHFGLKRTRLRVTPLEVDASSVSSARTEETVERKRRDEEVFMVQLREYAVGKAWFFFCGDGFEHSSSFVRPRHDRRGVRWFLGDRRAVRKWG
mmetsp:Transcript_6450/g.13427  ORF Transcript_6450/g.13427 Transcript_6450/m.13427 type:complete len:207 (+) Transcript_6450:497-1117(+)